MSNILLVEDDPDMRLMVRFMLGSMMGLDVVADAADAESAIEAAREHRPSIIILDNSLEGAMTGLQAAPLLRAIVPHAKIVLFSAYDLEREVADEPAIDLFLRKDAVRQLSASIERLLAVA